MALTAGLSAFSEPGLEIFTECDHPFHVLDGKTSPCSFTLILPPVAGLLLLAGSQER